MDEFAKRLKELRKQKKITQKQMSEMLCVTERHYQSIEYGKVNVQLTTLIFIADFFNVSIDYLAGRTDIKETKN